MNSPKIKMYFIYIALLLSSLAIALAANAKPVPQGEDSNIDYVFLQTANHGKIQYSTVDSTYKLILYKVDPWVTYLSSDPKKRITGFVQMQEFMKMWADNKKRDEKTEKLNSAIVAIQQGSNKSIRLAIALKNPVYDAVKQTITYDMDELKGDKAHPVPKGTHFKHAVLFIDDLDAGGAGGKFGG